MLEILFIIFLSKKIAAMMRAKGRSAGGYVALFVLLWFGGELSGGVVGMIVSGRLDAGAYAAALGGAALGATIAFLIANSVSSLTYDPNAPTGGFPVQPIPGPYVPPQAPPQPPPNWPPRR
jgi:hypothetical protein